MSTNPEPIKIIDIVFKGIDDWNRPVYKVIDMNVYIGDVNKLFNWRTPKEEVDAYFKTDDNIDCLVIFGSTFNEHDPLGTNIKKGIKLNIL